MKLPPMERVRIVSPMPNAETGGPVLLEDGRTVRIAPLEHIDVEVQPVMVRRMPVRRYDGLLRTLRRDTPLRVALHEGVIVGVASPIPKIHAVDMAILEAAGLDVDEAVSAYMNQIAWSEEGFEADEPTLPDRFHTGVRYRLTSALTDGFLYEAGVATVTGMLPDTILQGALGRSLRDVVEIPALADLDLRILEISQRPNPFSDEMQITIDLADEEGWRRASEDWRSWPEMPGRAAPPGG